MKVVKRILKGIFLLVVVLVVAFVVFIGPWPTYTAGFEGTGYYKTNLGRIDEAVHQFKVSDTPGQMKAGWGVAPIEAPAGVPMAGYSARQGRPSTGVHDPIYVKAVAFSDGVDTAVVVGSDMLLVPTNVAEMVREEVSKKTPLTANNILFTASHTHDSVGAFMPGIIATISFGKYDPAVPPVLAKAYTSAILDAYNSMKPAKFAHGVIDAAQYIHNRTRNAGVDPALNWMLIEKEGGDRCFVTRFSGHPTILDDDNMEISAEYPGYLQRAVEKATGATAVYLGGAVGSMSPSAPEAPTPFAKCEALGNALAQLVLQATQAPVFTDKVEVASISIPIELPPLQMRLFSTKWRLSPLSRFITGLHKSGWMSCVRVGDAVFVASPGDFSGEIAADWQQWASKKGINLWVSGFSGDYAGYISPDRYYGELLDKEGNMEYETGQLSWLGPHMEAFFTSLMQRMVDAMGAPQAAQAAPAQ